MNKKFNHGEHWGHGGKQGLLKAKKKKSPFPVVNNEFMVLNNRASLELSLNLNLPEGLSLNLNLASSLRHLRTPQGGIKQNRQFGMPTTHKAQGKDKDAVDREPYAPSLEPLEILHRQISELEALAIVHDGEG